MSGFEIWMGCKCPGGRSAQVGGKLVICDLNGRVGWQLYQQTREAGEGIKPGA